MTQTAEKENIMGTMPEGRLLLKLAMPMIFSVLVFGMNQVLVGLSLAAPAVYVIYNRVRSFVALPVWGIRNTIISVVAYNMGAGHKARVRNIISITTLRNTATS